MSAPTPRVLVVDDEPLLRELLQVHLVQEGFHVETAETGEDALAQLREHRPDLVLLDLMLPGISGLDVLETIRQTRSQHDLPVIVVSTEGGNPAIAEALRLGANDYVTKPFNFSLLVMRIATLVDVSRRARAVLGGELHVLEGNALPSAPEPVGWCQRCETALIVDEPACPTCSAARAATGWPTLADAPYPFLGRVVGGAYFVDQYIGAGAAGQVYRLRDLDLQRPFAGKFINLSTDDGEAPKLTRERVVAEVKALAKVQSPHVVKINRVMRVEDELFALVMEFVDGMTLDTLLEDVGRLSPKEAIAVARQVAQGLSEAHTHGLVHRDVKPGNIMLEALPAGDYFTRILDFGIVRTTSGPIAGEGFVGTPSYSSPEQIRELEQDHRVDIYGLGATLFHMLAGQPPFVANPMAVLVQHCTKPPPRLHEFIPEVPVVDALDALVQSMLAKTPDGRPASLLHVMQALDRVQRRLNEPDDEPADRPTELLPAVG
jgi:CheY-like chemotaxis protein